MTLPGDRFPAEWEPQDGVLLAWPHVGTDWAPWLDQVEQNYVALARAIIEHTRLLLVVRDESLSRRARRLIGDPHASRIEWLYYDYNDTWLRDSGPITLFNARGLPRWLDFRFTGWGGKYAAEADDALVEHLLGHPHFSRVQRERVDFALEGGAIETDGAGTLLSTWNCLEHRHPDKDRAQISALLCRTLACDRLLMLEHGELEGDDTDAHIDTLARFAALDAIVYQGCDDPADAHHAGLQQMATELAAMRTREGQAYRLFALPWAGRIEAADGRRLAASYANFLITNDAVLMPAYGVGTDLAAVTVLQLAFPERRVIAVPCRGLIEQNGSLHCVSMQLPKGVLANS